MFFEPGICTAIKLLLHRTLELLKVFALQMQKKHAETKNNVATKSGMFNFLQFPQR